VLEEVYRAARHAFPAECCGWLTGARDQSPTGVSPDADSTVAPQTGHWGDSVAGVRPCANQQGQAEHPTAPGRGAESAYVIAGDDLLALARGLDGPEPPRVIYHSHPNGRAYLSATDIEVATSPWGDGPAYPVQQLVVGIDEHAVREAALFAWSDEDGGFIEVARYPGAKV
jgi:proteasome lid subunit RPN8/RPN11